MPKRFVPKLATSQRTRIFIQDSTSTTGAGLAGLTATSSGLSAYYHLAGAGTTVAIPLVAGTLGTYVNSGGAGTGGGFVAVDAFGLYEICLPDAMLAGGEPILVLRGATNMVPNLSEYQLTGADFSASNGTNNALIGFGTGSGQLTTSTGQVTVATNNDKVGYTLGSFGFTVVASSVTGSVGSVAGNVAGSVGGVAGDTPQTGDVFALLNPMIASHIYTAAALQNGVNLAITSGVVVTGSTGSAVIVSGLPAGKSYVGQHLAHIPSAEARTIASQSYSAPNYTFNFTGTLGTEAGPFSSVTAGDVVWPTP